MRVKWMVCGWVALAAAGGIKLSAAVPAEFVNPPAEFRPMPFWSWNAALDDAEMRRQIVDFKDRGYGGYLMHPRVGLVTRYLGDEWFHKVQVCLDEGRKQGVQSWLYDEDKWPSGFAGGLAIFDHQEYIGMGMGVRRARGPQAAALATNADVLATFDVQSNSVRRLAGAADKAAGEVLQFFAQPYEKSNWYNGEAYLDTLNPEAVAHFLKLTITEGYDQRFKKDYGPAMPGIFTDEPNFMAGRGKGGTSFPWSRKLPEIFKQRRGYDLVDKLPCLVRQLPGHEQVRYDFWRTLAEQFEAAFSKPYGDLCTRSGLLYTGHYLAEDTLVAQTRVGGSVMLQYPHMHVPGIDHLARNIRDPQTKKQCSSVADQFGKARVLSEIYGVSGHSVTFEELKWMADYHFVLGVNLLVPHLTLYEMAGDRKRDYPATFSYHQPYWEQLAPVNEYLGRAAWFITRGQPRQDVLLLSTLGSVWAQLSPGDKADVRADVYSKAFQTYVAELLALHRDFHIGDEILMERHGRVEGGRLKIGPQGSYRAVVVPPALVWQAPTLKLLADFLAAGGTVLFLGGQPGAAQPLLAHPNARQLEAAPAAIGPVLAAVLPHDVAVTDAEGREIGDILYRHQQNGTQHYFFFANTSRTNTYRAQLKLAPELAGGAVAAWDLATGAVAPADLTHEFPPVGSLALCVDTAQAGASVPVVPQLAEKVEAIPGPFAFRRTQPGTLVLDTCRFQINGEPEQGPKPVSTVRGQAFKAAGLGAYVGMQPWALEWKGIKPTQSALVAMKFSFESELDLPQAWLVVEKPEHYQIKCNGQAVTQRDGWHWDRQFGKMQLGALVRRGRNTLELTTTYKPGVEIEDIFVIGDFATHKLADTAYAITAEPRQLAAGDWTGQGYHFYSGNIAYRFSRTFAAGERARLRVSRPMGTAFLVRVNGRDVAQLNWAPWEADLTAALKPGANAIELVVLSSLQNTFGPLHNKKFLTGNDWWVGPDAFADQKAWMDAYFHSPYGFAGLEWVTTPAAQ